MTLLLESRPALTAAAPIDMGSFLRRWTRGIRKVWQRRDWPTFAGEDWLERVLEVELTDDFHAKQGRSTARWVLEQDSRQLAVYLKRHYRLGWWRGLLAAFWPRRDWSPAFQEMRHLQWAADIGLPAPKVVAAAEFIGPRGKLQSVLAIEELRGMICLHEAIPLAAQRLTSRAFQRWKATLAVEMARLARFLHDRRCFHKDFYLCHFFVPQNDTLTVPDSWAGRVHLIDFHRLGRHPWTWPIWRLKDLGQLLYSSYIPGISELDRLRFWRHYVGTGRRRSRLLTWAVCFKGKRYHNHNTKKRK